MMSILRKSTDDIIECHLPAEPHLEARDGVVAGEGHVVLLRLGQRADL